MRARLGRWLTGGLPGQAVVWAAVMMPMFLAVVGLAIDGGVAMKAQRQLQNVADGAARAGAMQIDQQAYRASSGSALQLDPGKAREVAAQYVTAQAPNVSGDVTADPQQVVVSLKQHIPTTFIQIVGIDHMDVEAVAPARIRFGIQQEVGGTP